MTEFIAKAPEGMHTITPHIVVSDATAATDWYEQVLGAEERSRIQLPGGKLMQVELWFGDSAVMLADEFPELGVLSPLSVGGTATVLHLYTNDVDALWNRAIDASRTCSGVNATVRSPTPSVTAGALHSICAMCRMRRLPTPRLHCSASTSMVAHVVFEILECLDSHR
jgi:uncharacterized glyoxalase superfamily protein PhnB